ncbi:hypothetical protein AB1Y20_007156 [Prymnesium parvum]|uniref:Tubulin-specific chaperone A n=1 Tax=Prymnesium parvum TaxID=97485 RepID=A0AB34IU44_PRYPA
MCSLAECVRAPSLPPVEESSRLRHETKIREEELQMAAERIAYLRTRNENIARKNQDVAEAEKRLLDAREHERAAYIARLRAQTAELFASRQEQSEARAELADVARQVGEELAARVERVQQALHALLHAEPHEAAEARLEAAEAHRALLAWLEGAG